MPKIFWRSGVYCLLCAITKKRYVGSSSKSVRTRLFQHRSELRKGKHKNDRLQKAWNKYGEASFRLIIIERCSPDQCLEREQHWIDFHQSADRNLGYNIAPRAESTRGLRPSAVTREKMRQARLKYAAENPELIREQCGKASRGKKKSEETKFRMSEARKRFWNSSPVADRVRSWWTDFNKSSEQREANREAMRLRNLDPEFQKRRLVNATKGRARLAAYNQTPERREVSRQNMLKFLQNPELVHRRAVLGGIAANKNITEKQRAARRANGAKTGKRTIWICLAKTDHSARAKKGNATYWGRVKDTPEFEIRKLRMAFGRYGAGRTFAEYVADRKPELLHLI